MIKEITKISTSVNYRVDYMHYHTITVYYSDNSKITYEGFARDTMNFFDTMLWLIKNNYTDDVDSVYKITAQYPDGTKNIISNFKTFVPGFFGSIQDAVYEISDIIIFISLQTFDGTYQDEDKKLFNYI